VQTEINSLRTNAPPNDRMDALIFGRLAAIFLLLLASWWWNYSYLQISNTTFPLGLFLFFLCSLGLTAVYQTVAHFNRNYGWQVRVQLLLDVFLVTWLVWQTGGVTSAYVTLYIIATAIAGLYLDKSETLLIAAMSAALFTVLAVLSGESLQYSLDGDMRSSRVVQVVAFNDVAILLVGLIAARLAARRRLADDLLKAEESFADLHLLHERIVESIDSGLITTALDGTVYSFNRAAEKISGLRAAETIGRDVRTIFDADIRRQIEKCLGAIDRSGFPAEIFEALIVRPAADFAKPNKITVSCSIAPLYSRAGTVSGLVVSFHDISAMRSLEESLRRADKLAAVGRLAAGLAHEIRNPLGSMSSALQFVQEKVPPGTDEASMMDVVLRESRRLNNIIANFLAYARPSSDGFRASDTAYVDLGDTIRDCIALLRHSPEFTDAHRLEFVPPRFPLRIEVSETQIKQVLWNLLQNSIQAMPDGGEMSVGVKDDGDGNVHILVEDTGCGFSAENHEQLFEPFSHAAAGTGLGLSIVHKIVVDHGGRIDVNSAKGKGTRVTIELPRARRGDAAAKVL
jgi:two-component system sensor histidine kinase PilS (NtrC family)